MSRLFDGASKIEVNDNTKLDFSFDTPFSILWRQKITATGEGGLLRSWSKMKTTASYPGYAIYCTVDTYPAVTAIINLYETNDTKKIVWGATKKLTAGVWEYLAFTYDGQNLDTSGKLYVNCVSSLTSSTKLGAPTTASNTGKFTVGAWVDQFFVGQIADLRVFGRLLSLQEIKAMQWQRTVNDEGFYLPLVGADIAEIKGKLALTTTGTTQAKDPPISLIR